MNSKRWLFVPLVCVAACSTTGFSALQTAEYEAPPADEVQLIKNYSRSWQQRSFVEDVEFCSYLAEDANGALVFTETVKGDRFGCTPEVPDNLTPIASFHTHGAYDAEIPSEFPSSDDLRADADEGVDGYVATPGGRLWYIDGDALIARQLCGVGCLVQDPDFRTGDDGVIETEYNYRQIKALE